MKKYFLLILICFLILLGTYLIANYFVNPLKLKIYNPTDVNPELVDNSVQSVNYNHKIANFELIDQDSNIVTEKLLKNKIYIADFFFATCKTICPKMSKQMKRISKEFIDDKEILLLSHTVMPENDNVEVLKSYAEKYNINSGKWRLLTGDKTAIYKLARESYLVGKYDKKKVAPQFIHTENFVLVDKNLQIRGFYNGTSKKSINNLIRDIYILKKEYD